LQIDGSLGGNIAVVVEGALVVSRSGKAAGVRLSQEDFVDVVRFDQDLWRATYNSADGDIAPTSDTPLHW